MVTDSSQTAHAGVEVVHMGTAMVPHVTHLSFLYDMLAFEAMPWVVVIWVVRKGRTDPQPFLGRRKALGRRVTGAG